MKSFPVILGSAVVLTLISSCKPAEPIRLGVPRDNGYNSNLNGSGQGTTTTTDPNASSDPNYNPPLEKYTNKNKCYKAGELYVAPAKTVAVVDGTGSSKISGFVFFDANGNGVMDAGERGTGQAQWRPYIDMNNNGIQDNGDHHVSNYDPNSGYWDFLGKITKQHNSTIYRDPVPNGTYAVRISDQFPQIAADGYPAYKFTMADNKEAQNINFAMSSKSPLIDKGNAPGYYGEATAPFNIGYFMGEIASEEPDQSKCKSNDGASFPPVMKYGASFSIGVIPGGGQGYVSIWIDFNADGDFQDAGENVVVNQIVYGRASFPGGQQYSAKAPAAPANAGAKVKTWARVRFGIGVQAPFGAQTVGEVEDYEVEISR